MAGKMSKKEMDKMLASGPRLGQSASRSAGQRMSVAQAPRPSMEGGRMASGGTAKKNVKKRGKGARY